MARLILSCEGVDLVMRELARDIVMIGRAPSNQIVIDHPTVSAQHAVLLRTGNSYSWTKTSAPRSPPTGFTEIVSDGLPILHTILPLAGPTY